MDKKVKDNKVLFVITTDGLENASHKYTKEQIKEDINMPQEDKYKMLKLLKKLEIILDKSQIM